MTELPEMMSVKDVARHLNVGRRTVYRLIENGKLRAIRYADDGPYRIFPESVASFLGVTVIQKKTTRQKKKNEHLALAAMARLGV